MSDTFLEEDQIDLQDDFKPAPVGVEELLLRVRELIDLARSMPMSASRAGASSSSWWGRRDMGRDYPSLPAWMPMSGLH